MGNFIAGIFSNFVERDFTTTPLTDEEIDVLMEQIPKDDVLDSLNQEDKETIMNNYPVNDLVQRLGQPEREKIVKAMSDQKIFNLRGDNIFDYYLTNSKSELKNCMKGHMNKDGTVCEDEKFKRMITTIPNLVMGPLGEKQSQWDTEKKGLEAQWDTEKKGLEAQWDTEKKGLEAQWDTEKKGLQAQWYKRFDDLNKDKQLLETKNRNDEIKWESQKTTLEEDITKNLQTQFDTEKQNLQTQWGIEKQNLQTQWDTEKQNLVKRYNTLDAAYDSLEKQKFALETDYDNLQQTLKPTLETIVLRSFLSEPDVYNKILKENISQTTLDIFTKDGDINFDVKEFLKWASYEKQYGQIAYEQRKSKALLSHVIRIDSLGEKEGRSFLDNYTNTQAVNRIKTSGNLTVFFFCSIYLFIKIILRSNSTDKQIVPNETVYNNYKEFFNGLGIEQQQFEYALKFIGFNAFKKFMDYDSKNNVRGLNIVLKDILNIVQKYIGEEYIGTRIVNTDLTFNYVHANIGKPDMSVSEPMCKLYIESKEYNFSPVDYKGAPSGCLISKDPNDKSGLYNKKSTENLCSSESVDCVQKRPDVKNFVKNSLGKPDMSLNEFECKQYAKSNNLTFHENDDTFSKNNNSCSTWANNDECSKNPSYMWKDCGFYCAKQGSPKGCVLRGSQMWYNKYNSSRNCNYASSKCIQKKPKVDNFQIFTVGKPDMSVSEFECDHYAKLLDKSLNVVNQENDPRGCYVYKANGDIIYNTQSTKDINCKDTHSCIQKPMDTSRFQIVKDGPNDKTVSEQQCQAYSKSKGKDYETMKPQFRAFNPLGCQEIDNVIQYNPRDVTGVPKCNPPKSGHNGCIQRPWKIEDFSRVSSGQPFANNHSRYINETKCQLCADLIGADGYQKNSWDNRLKGCSIDSKHGVVYFNTHETGLSLAGPFETETIKSPTDFQASDKLGKYIAMSEKYAVVGFPGFPDTSKVNPQEGKAYIFEVSTGKLLHIIQAKDKTKWDNFGWRVAIGGPQGSHVILSAVFAKNNAGVSAAGALYVFGADTGKQISKITVEDSDVGRDVLGESLDIDDGYKVIAGATWPNPKEKVLTVIAGATGYGSGGAAYIFNIRGTVKQLHKLTVSGSKKYSFGCSVGISGDYAVVGDKDDSDSKGAAYIFKVSTGTMLHKITAKDGKKKDYFGYSIGIDGNYIVVGAKGVDNNKGAAYVYDTSGKQLHKLTAEDGKEEDKFGDQHGVSISGKYAIIGSKYNDNSKGAAYIFNVETGELYKKLVGRDKESFGWGVSIHGNNAMIGAPSHNGNGKSNTGGIYFYTGASGSGSAECGTGGQECIAKALTKEDFTISKDGKPQHNVVNQKYIPIMNEKECKKASTIIGGPNVKWSKFKYTALPVGCVYRPSENRFQWNTYTDELFDCEDGKNCVSLK